MALKEDFVWPSEVLALLKQQASALERLAGQNDGRMPRSLEEPAAHADEPSRPASAIDHKWAEQLSKQPMIIESNVVVLGIEGIDTASHSFCANIVAEFRVRYSGDVRDWDPKIRCTNLKENTQEPMESQYMCADGSYCFKRHWHGVFIEHLELCNFPMDIQDISFEFVSDWPAEKVKFVKSRSHDSKVSGLGCDVIQDVWAPTMIQHATKHCNVDRVAIRAREDITEGSGMHIAEGVDMLPSITFTLQVRRRAANYLYNIIIPTAALTTLAFSSFAVPLNEVADRASITLTLLLSIIAYKLIIKDELPKVNFLTLIDNYILASMAILAIISFANAIVGSGVEAVTSDVQRKDDQCRLVLAIMWTLCNMLFVVRIIFRQCVAGRRIKNFKRECSEKREDADVLLLV